MLLSYIVQCMRHPVIYGHVKTNPHCSQSTLTHCGLATLYGDIDLQVNIGLGNGLLPDGTKPFTEQVLTYHKNGSLAFNLKQFHKKGS